MVEDNILQIFSCGIDIEEIERFEKYYAAGASFSSGSLNELFTEHEKIQNRDIGSKAATLSFCCKEAVFKAAGKSWRNSDVFWTDIELDFQEDKNFLKHKLNFYGTVLDFLKEEKVRSIKSDFEINNSYAIFKIVFYK